jgi:hypothetical protein
MLARNDEGNPVDLIIEAFWALALVGIPITLFTLAVVWWGMRNGHFLATNDGKELRRELKAFSKSKAKTKTEKDNRSLVHKNWARFGGGFYGIVAFFTYIVIEITEISTMIINLGGLWAFIQQLDIGFIIEIFIEALTNFIAAMVWPLYWMQRIDTSQTWLWFIAAYAGYWLGLRIAQDLNQRRSEALKDGDNFFALEYFRDKITRYFSTKKAESGGKKTHLNGREE